MDTETTTTAAISKNSLPSIIITRLTVLLRFAILIITCLTAKPTLVAAAGGSKNTLCRATCGDIPIRYPFGIDDGCGSPYYRYTLVCSDLGVLHLRTPSGRYPVRSISYPERYLVVSDPLMWRCQDGDRFRPTRAFSIDTSTHFSVSPHNDYLFFNCSAAEVIVEPRPMFCQRFPDHCDASCDSASFLCRHLPGCASALSGRGASCCSYYPRATESLRLMLEHCATYASVYWRRRVDGEGPPYSGEVAEFGIRIDFEIPVTALCLRCQDEARGSGGTCGFDTRDVKFLCLCQHGNDTVSCKENGSRGHAGVIAGTVGGLSAAGVIGVSGGIWYLKNVRAKAPVMSGVQSTENRLF